MFSDLEDKDLKISVLSDILSEVLVRGHAERNRMDWVLDILKAYGSDGLAKRVWDRQGSWSRESIDVARHVTADPLKVVKAIHQVLRAYDILGKAQGNGPLNYALNALSAAMKEEI